MSKKWLVWAKRTLTGYTVVFVNVDYEHTVKHRPFRSPIMKSTRLTKNTLKGKSYSMLVYDEVSYLTQEQVNDLVVKSVNANTDTANPPSDPKRKANT